MLVLSTRDPFAPGATVEVRSVDTIDATLASPVVTFVVGYEPDTAPPTWDGAFTVDNAREVQFHPCVGIPTTYREHTFRWIGLHDESWPTEELFVVAEPRLESAETLLGTGDRASITFGGVCGPDIDESLRGDFHRAYDVFVEDGAGNRIGPFEVDTRERESDGCAALAASRTSIVLVVAAIAAQRRRRSLASFGASHV